MTGRPHSWHVEPTDEQHRFACDELVGARPEVWTRAVTVQAAAPVVFRWLCQLRAAPYSYDLLDNVARRSPATLTPGLDLIEPGQRAMRVFVVAAVQPGRSITFVPRSRRPAWFAMTYLVVPQPDGTSRLVARVAVARRGGRAGAAARYLLAWGDLVMMRRQLQRLGVLAAAQASTGR